MALFRAYSANISKPEEDAVPSTSAAAKQWLENASFSLKDHQIRDAQNQPNTSMEVDSDKDGSEGEDIDDQSDASLNDQQSDRQSEIQKKVRLKTLEFQGDEEFYIDKEPSKHYKTIQELHKPACPRYRKNMKYPIGENWFSGTSKQLRKRYYRHKHECEDVASTVALSENEFTEQLGNLNRKTIESPKELKPWLDLIDLQDKNPYKLTKLPLAERKLDIIVRALNYNPKSDELYHRYIDIINSTYPSFEVNKMLDRLLNKDPYSYTLWTAQILATQCSMARCVVPDVLKIYERCMQKMYLASQRSEREGLDDSVMLKLFNNCALFLRQAGLNEQFFALIKLALELNVSTDKIESLQTLDSDQATLIEYEELILQSGLPMHEIWLRIEKLRQAFDFLPIPLNSKCSDPQRIVFNEDVCHYIYPLKSRENSFYLILLVLRLLKFPFVHCDMLAEKFCARVQDIGDSDAIEDTLIICLRSTFSYGAEQQRFFSSLYELTKEMSVSPTFLSSHIGHELYIRCITQLLLNCASAYEGIDERKRIALLLLWCRFERMLLMLQKCAKKLTIEYIRAGRSRFKAMLKQQNNITVINFYTEFAMYEYEAAQGVLEEKEENMQTVRNIFENVIAKNTENESCSKDVCFACITYAQILISSGCREEALRLLVSYITKSDIKHKAESNLSNPKKLAALQSISKKLDEVIAIESNIEIMVLEQYLLPDSTVSLLYMRVLLQYLMGQKQDAVAYLDKLLRVFKKTSSERSCFLREQIYEIYVGLLGQKSERDCSISNSLLCTKVSEALVEFPRNLFLMQSCGTLNSLPWYKLRGTLLRGNFSAMSVVLLITSARYRFMDRITTNTGDDDKQINTCDLQHNESTVRNRILSVFKTLITSDADSNNNKYIALRRNSLIWRLYLRCLSDQSVPFDMSKKCLLQALDECPWSKALYMDGARYVPEELSHLQDLIIEKHMRIYALPDELEILREK